MSTLQVPEASLYHEKTGNGHLLLCISGADGSCEVWRGLAESLKDRFTVVMWDRRGFSRSPLTDAQDYEHRLETDADDAARLIEEYSPNEPATVIGNSSGAIIALKLLVRHPDRIRTLLPYEPPASRVLPDFNDIWTTHEDVYATYRRAGPFPALEKFAELTKTDQSMVKAFVDFQKPYLFSNLQYWFEREFMTYPQASIDIEKDLRPLQEKLVFVNGELSSKEPYQYRANVAMAERLGLELQHFPGEHMGHATHSKAFGEKLVEVLRAKSEFYAEVRYLLDLVYLMI